jgi:hypothetical protein
VPPFSPFALAILETYGIQAIHLHPKSVTLLAVFAYAFFLTSLPSSSPGMPRRRRKRRRGG